MTPEESPQSIKQMRLLEKKLTAQKVLRIVEYGTLGHN